MKYVGPHRSTLPSIPESNQASDSTYQHTGNRRIHEQVNEPAVISQPYSTEGKLYRQITWFLKKKEKKHILEKIAIITTLIYLLIN